MYHLKLSVARQTSDIDAHLGTEKQERREVLDSSSKPVWKRPLEQGQL